MSQANVHAKTAPLFPVGPLNLGAGVGFEPTTFRL